MAIEKQERWKCDLCGGAQIKKEEKTKGWVAIEVDDLFQARVWHSKVICNNCMEKIDRARKQA